MYAGLCTKNTFEVYDLETIQSLYMKEGKITGTNHKGQHFAFDLPAGPQGDVHCTTTKQLFLRLKEEWTIARHDAAHLHASKAAKAHATRSKLQELGASSPRKVTRNFDVPAANYELPCPGTPFDVQV